MNIRAVIFDWAGTMVDHGSRAPVATLQRVFAEAGVAVSIAEAREAMGIAKKDHIRAICGIPRVAAHWAQVHGSRPGEAEVDGLYASFQPRQLADLSAYANVIPGVAETVEALRSRGVRIGSTTGYTRPMLDFLVARAAEQGLRTDAALCPDDAPAGRPAPWMCWGNAIRLQVYPLHQMVKIGDTPSDIEEGRNAGMWTIGITRTGNEVGLTEQEWAGTDAQAQQELLEAAARRLAEADYLAEDVAGCLPLLEEISARIAAGERPR